MDLSFTPIAKPQPDKGLKFTKFASDGGAAVRAVFPGAEITSGHRTNNIGSPNDDHHFSNGAVDVAPVKGMTFDQFTAKLKAAGYPIIQAIDEVNHPSKGATGPHWHVALGEHETGLAFTPHSPPNAAGGGLPFTPASTTPKAPKSAQRAGKPAPSAPEKELGLGEALWQGVKNIPKSAVDNVKGVAHAVAHPIETVDSLTDLAAGGVLAGASALGLRKDKGSKPEKAFHSTVDPWIEHPYRQAKKSIAEDPVGTALTFAPVGGAARIAGKLGVRGVEAAKLANMAPEARAAYRAQRVEDAAVAKRYKDTARPIMAKHRLDAERASEELRKHQRVVGNLPVEEQRKLAMAADTGDRTGIDPKHHAALDAVRKVAKDYDGRIHAIYAKGGHSLPEFMDSYYTHLWKEAPGEVKKAMGRQGSSRNLKQRTLPTLADGIRAGLTPKYENMLDTMTHYAHTMSAHLVNHDLMNAMRKDSALGAKFVSKHNIPDGMSRVEGIGTEREGRGISKAVDGQDIHTGNAPPMVLAAKSKAAELYNRRIGKSVMDNPVGRGIKKVSGAVVAAKLFSAYHPTLIAGKAVASDIGNGIRHLSRGAPISAVKALAHMPFAPALTARQGAKMGARLLKGDDAMKEVDHLFVKAGGSTSGGLAPYRTVEHTSLADSAFRGTFRTDLKRSFSDAMKGSALQRTGGAVKGAMRTAFRALDVVNDLTFRHYVPAIKRGAFERELTTSLQAHPEWGDAEKLAEARKVLSSVEGRMGLVTKDNLFWSNTAHDIGRVIFLSPSWQLGNARILRDALEGVPKEQRGFFHGKGITNGRAQAAGLLGSYMLGNAVLQYLYTGEPPKETHDLMAAKTGGKNKDGTEERVTTPSVIPELYRWFSAPEEEAGNVLNPSLKTGFDLGENRDFRNQHIYRPDYASPWPHSRAQDIGAYAAQGVTPIPLSGNDNPDTAVSPAARLAGLRPAGKAFSNPEGYTAMRRSIADKESYPTVRRERQEDAKKKRKKP